MQTNFTDEQLADSSTKVANEILRTCVHCGFCLSTCPTYTLLGDELDSPRGRIYLIKEMLEKGEPATEQVVKHIDRCLSCLSCMSTCPSGVDYSHLVDHARKHIERTYRRPLADRTLRRLLGLVLPRPRLFRALLIVAAVFKPLARLFPPRLRAALDLIPSEMPTKAIVSGPLILPSVSKKKWRVAMLPGCAQQVLAPQINEATIRLLTRHGCEVVIPAGLGCRGALTHHLGQDGHRFARENIEAWCREIEVGGLDAIVVNTSGCGAVIKDYGFMFRDDPLFAGKAKLISSITRDITEFMAEIGLRPIAGLPVLRVAYHAACSLQHGQRVRAQPKKLLQQAGFMFLEPKEAHICCGSAGTYNLLQPRLAEQLRDRKVLSLEDTSAQVIAAGNIGCMTHIMKGTSLPIVHTVELLDWASGGPRPSALAHQDEDPSP